MKITVLDGYCLNPGDLSWDSLGKLGELKVYDRTSPEKLLVRASDSEVLITNKTCLDASSMAQLPKLKYVGVLATGYNVVDTKYAAEHGIVVTNIPAYSTMSVAQMVFAHILHITQRVGHYAEENANGRWSDCQDFSYADMPLIELCGKTMGLVGLGNTGMATARIALSFGMNVIAVTSKQNLPDGIRSVSRDELFRQSDVLSLHCPLNDSTRNYVNASTLSLMKPTAILINAGRGPLVDEEALADALNHERIYAAGLDVMVQEPPCHDNPLLTARNCFITPHIAWATKEARQRLMSIAVDNVRSWMSGSAQNVVH